MKALGIAILSILVVTIGPAAAAATVPAVLHYEGFLSDVEGNPVTDEWPMTFGLYTEAQGGSPVFEETQSVPIAGGVFFVLLGAQPDNGLDPALVSSGELWIQVTVVGDGGPVTLEPRQQVVSHPYALFAQRAVSAASADDAAKLGGMDAETFVTLEDLKTMCLPPEDLAAKLAELGFVPGAHYSDEDVQAYLDANGYDAGAGYSDESVQAFLDGKGYAPGPYYSDTDTQAYLEEKGYVAGPGYSDADAKAFLDAGGYLPGPYYSDSDAQSYLDQKGYVAGPHYTDTNTQSYLDQKGYVAGPHYADGDTQAYLDAQGYVPGPHLTVDQCLDAVAAQGYLKPGEKIAPDMLPPDGLDEVSNGLLTATFDNTFSGPTAPLPIVDGFLAGVSHSLVIPELGTIQDINIDLAIAHVDPKQLKVTLTTPGGKVFVLHDHGPSGAGGITTNFDLDTKPVSGDLSSLDGSSPAGTWTLKIVDDVLGGDGTLTSWAIHVQTLSPSNLYLAGSLTVKGGFALEGSNVSRSTLQTLTAGKASAADALHTHTNLAVYFKENTGIWGGGGGLAYQGGAWMSIYGGAVAASDPATSTLVLRQVTVSGNHGPGWAGYVCLCAKGSISAAGGPTVQLEEKCGGATNQTVTLSWPVDPGLTSVTAGSLSLQGKSCGGNIQFSGASITGDQYLPVKLVK